MAKKPETPPEPERLDFEQALAELEEIVHVLEDGEIGLNESLARYEKGVTLLRQCYNMLDGAQRRIELLTAVDAEGRPVASAVDDTQLSLAEKAQRRSRRRSSQSPPPSSEEGGELGPGDMDVSGDMF
ncbi:MAG: exodeoxyribonuclease VII small subunit [Thermoguttaceae bacterium]